MRHNVLPPLGVLDNLFDADFENGQLRWKNPLRAWMRGRVAGTLSVRGYRKVKISGRDYPAHRVLYAMRHRKDPRDMEIDHINGIKDDNREDNLRLATRSLNCVNHSSWRKGLRGAYYRQGTWMAVIQVEKVRHYLGNFSTEEAAHAAFSAAALAQRGAIARLD